MGVLVIEAQLEFPMLYGERIGISAVAMLSGAVRVVC